MHSTRHHLIQQLASLLPSNALASNQSLNMLAMHGGSLQHRGVRDNHPSHSDGEMQGLNIARKRGLWRVALRLCAHTHWPTALHGTQPLKSHRKLV